jgi:ADP-heptose:LPS heptosyltransferase
VGFVQAGKGAAFSALVAAERMAHASARQPLAGTKNFLLMQYATALGTTVHATPVVPALRAAVPGCRIAVAASGFALEVFRNNPGVDWLIETPSPLKDLRGAATGLRRQVPFGAERFAALTTVGNERTRVGIAALLSGASSRVGFAVNPELFHAALHFDRERSLIDNNLRLVEAFGIRSRHFEPQIFFGQAELAWAKETLRNAGVRDGQIVAALVTQTSVTQRKSWRPERFQAAARHLIERYGAHLIFAGTEAESAAIDELRAPLGDRTTSVAGKTSLLQLGALLSLCRVGLTLDTGPLHIGRAVGLPMVIVAPAWSPPLEWLPLGDCRYRILKNGDLPECPPDYVIDEVSVGEVTAALDELMAEYPAGALRDELIQGTRQF